MKATLEWLADSHSEFAGGDGRTGFAQLRHYTAEYREWGSGEPIVLVPGLAGGYNLVGPLAKVLAPHYRVISYKLRGEDDCFALRRGFNLSNLVEDLVEFLDWHRLESPTVFGVSFGGVLALEMAARFPYRLQSLGVQGVGARFERGLLQRVASMVLSDYPLPPDNPFVNQFFNLLFGSRQKDTRMFQFVTRQCWHTDQSVMAHRFRLVEQFNMVGRLQRIRVPTLVLAGDRDLLVSEKGLNELQAGLHDGQLVRLPGAGHLAFVNMADRVGAELCRFLNA